MSRTLLSQAAISLVALLLVSGCGGKVDRPPVFKAGGVIRLGGKPVPDALVQFIPAAGRPATGKTNSNGEFTLTTFNTNDGAVEGSHTVTVTVAMAETIVSNTPDELKAIEKANAAVPLIYKDPKTSGLVNTVEKTGKNHFEIDLK